MDCFFGLWSSDRRVISDLRRVQLDGAVGGAQDKTDGLQRLEAVFSPDIEAVLGHCSIDTVLCSLQRLKHILCFPNASYVIQAAQGTFIEFRLLAAAKGSLPLCREWRSPLRWTETCMHTREHGDRFRLHGGHVEREVKDGDRTCPWICS